MWARLTHLHQQFQALIAEDPRIRNRFLAVLFLLVLLFFLSTFSLRQGFPFESGSESRLVLFLAINVNIVLIAIVFYLIAKNLLKLAYERRQRALGVNLKTKLILAFIVLSLPALGFHLFASTFVVSTLENWIVNQHSSVVRSAQQVSEVYHQNLRNSMELQGQLLEWQLREQWSQGAQPHTWKPDRQLAAGVVLYDVDHTLLQQALRTEAAQLDWRPLTPAEWQQVEDLKETWLTEAGKERLLYRHIRQLEVEGQVLFLEIFQPAERPVSQAINTIIEQNQTSQFLTYSEDQIRRYYVVVFILMISFILFVATWLAFYLARGFVEPIEELARATERVAGGELGYQVQIEMALDRDFALLISSFNAMSTELRENRLALEKTTEHLQQSHRALEEHTRFVELVLENISTGVISLDPLGHVEGINNAAKELLPILTTEYRNLHFRDVLPQGEVLQALEEMLAELDAAQPLATRNLTLLRQQAPVQVAFALLPLRNREGFSMGTVLVCNNITEIQRLQRAQAWREVARRIAHEIKNPLTPIQLSAERLLRKYAPEVQDDTTLRQATQTIIREVERLKQMVAEFSLFARIPESNPQPDNLNDLLREVQELYAENLPGRIMLRVESAPDLPEFSFDREQMRRALINLVDNAIDAIENKGRLSRWLRQGEILLRTEYERDLKIARLEVLDNGSGIEPEIAERLFDPYATTKPDGTGLGLTILQQTVSDHNGFVRFQNREDGGATFTIELPTS